MKSILKTLAVAVIALIGFATQSQAQDIVKLEQTPGTFDKTEITLQAGTYVFEVSNSGVDHEVGFVIAEVNRKGKTGDHVKTGYLAKTINNGESARSQEVELKPGTYRYFCPLNPTPEYTITVTK